MNPAPRIGELRLSDGLSRREWLRIGGLGAMGVSLSDLLGASAAAKTLPLTARPATASSFGRAKSCLLIFLTGGPPQHETFDPKPGAPSEIRGPFGSIRTSVPGVHFSELLPNTASVADRLTIVRSMTTDINAHSTSGYWMLTGTQHPTPSAESPAGPDDWPSLAAVVGQMKPSERMPFSSVVLPEPIVNNPNIPWPGQDGGMMGPIWNPQLLRCDPNAEQFELDGIRLPAGVDLGRLARRSELLRAVDSHFIEAAKSEAMSAVARVQQQAFEVVQSATAQAAFRLEKEPTAVRDMFTRTKFGQSLLLARRLIESGVRLVQVNWPRVAGDTSIGNPVWDTHSKNAERCRDVLCPQFDAAFAALIRDLESRGLLSETLVVVMGEFGRSPQINKDGGRDHWGHCFSIALAGAGVPGGQVVGASDPQGGYPIARPIRPTDLAATIFHLLGVRSDAEFADRLGRPRTAVNGAVISELAS